MQELRRLLRYFFQLLSHCQGGHKAFRLSRFHLKGHFFVIFRIKLSFNHSAAVDVSVRKSDHCLTAQHLEETVIVFQQKSVITPEIMQIFRAVRQKISTSYSAVVKTHRGEAGLSVKNRASRSALLSSQIICEANGLSPH